MVEWLCGQYKTPGWFYVVWIRRADSLGPGAFRLLVNYEGICPAATERRKDWQRENREP